VRVAGEAGVAACLLDVGWVALVACEVTDGDLVDLGAHFDRAAGDEGWLVLACAVVVFLPAAGWLMG
jgi:acyl-coenzyme A thioesterase PaaI-like protein